MLLFLLLPIVLMLALLGMDRVERWATPAPSRTELPVGPLDLPL